MFTVAIARPAVRTIRRPARPRRRYRRPPPARPDDPAPHDRGTDRGIDVDTGRRGSHDTARVPTIAASGPAVPIQELVGIVAAEIPDGTVLEADLGTEDGRVVWEVLVRTPGAIIELYVEATTGEILKSEPAS